VLQCISLTEVDRISIDLLTQFNNLYDELQLFFNESKSQNFDNNINKELYNLLIKK